MSLVEMTGIKKSFYGVEVLHSVDFVLEPGMVHALMGENGAGKSTLVKIIAGMHKHDDGEVRICGKKVNIDSPFKAGELGIAMIHQELMPVLEMTVAENIYLGSEPRKMGMLDFNAMYAQTEELLNKLNIKINPKVKMKKLRVADQQMVEIAKSVRQNAKIVIMDEPTSSITDKEVASLFRIINDMKAQGTGIVYISHKMDEIFRIADQITVLRDGEYVNTWESKNVDIDTLIKSMVGRELKEQFPKVHVPIGEKVLEVKNISLNNQYENISFDLHKGEILGFVGLVGAGRTEVMRSIFGITRPDSGEIYLKGKKVCFKSPKEAIKNKIAYVTEDRKGEGLVLPLSIQKNITLVQLKDFAKAGWLNYSKEQSVVQEQMASLKIKATGSMQKVNSLSGGNQQKVVLAKWMIAAPEIMIFDEPTRGIDVGAKAEIYKIMNDYVAAGNSIIMISSEIPEAIGMSDRLIALSNRKMSGELSKSEFSQEVIVQLQFKHMMDSKNAGGK